LSIGIGLVIPDGVILIADGRQEWPQSSARYAFDDAADTSIKRAWSQFLKRRAPDVNTDHLTIKAALIVGGLSQDSPFVVASLHGSGVSQEPLSAKDSFQFIVFGGEEYRAQSHFASQLQRVVKKDTWSLSDGPHNSSTRKILQAANNTIRCIESLDSSVGGIVRYAIVRKGFPVIKEVYRSHNRDK